MLLWATNPRQYVDADGERIGQDEDGEDGLWLSTLPPTHRCYSYSLLTITCL
jgi:hypothetical protein